MEDYGIGLDLQDRLFDAIASFCEKGGTQRMIILPKRDYKVMSKVANSTALGRFFGLRGFSFFTLPVYCYNGEEIVIA